MRLKLVGALLLVFAVVSVTADDKVYVEKEGAGRVGIDIGGMSVAGAPGVLFRRTLSDDLERSGWFVVRSGASVVVSGSFSDSGSSAKVAFQALNKSTHARYVSRTLTEQSGQARRLAHRVADAIVEGVLGKRGIASTRIAMVGSRGGRKDIYICDADGAGLVNITRKGAVCLTPNWGPEGKSLVYTSFHRGFPDVYRIDLVRKKLGRMSGFPGLNAGADISPDGRRMVLTLSKDGNPDLYVMDLRTRRLTRITRTRHGAEASPSWSPDGKQVVFVSDKSGSPQLYVVGARGGDPKRVTFRGSENVAPDWGPDGRVVYSSRRGGRYQICMISPGQRDEPQLTQDFVDHEDPCWAPDARHIAYVQTVRYHSDLYILDTKERRAVRLTTVQGDWYSPAWSSK